MAPTLLLPKSRGYVRIRSADPFVHPIIQPNYLSDEEGVRARVRELWGRNFSVIVVNLGSTQGVHRTVRCGRADGGHARSAPVRERPRAAQAPAERAGGPRHDYPVPARFG